MSNNQPPPGPYGQQPQQPNPYQQPGPQQGQPGQPGQQPGYGYPQQAPPPQQGYGYPQQPGQPGPGGPPPGGPYPGQQPYGQPGMPQPPQGGGGNGKTIGIIVGALVVVAAIIVGVVLFTGGDDDDKAGGDSGGTSEPKEDGGKGGEDGGGEKKPEKPEKLAPYKIVAPDSVLAGEYKSSGSATNDEDLTNDADAKKIGVTNATGASDTYKSSAKESLQLAAIYGTVADPDAAAKAMFDKVHDNQTQATGIDNYKVETVEGPKDYTPEGFDGEVLRCETRKQTGQISGTAVELIFPTCVWSDSAAVGVVSQMGPEPAGGGAGKYGKSMSQDDLAETTAEIREDAREEL